MSRAGARAATLALAILAPLLAFTLVEGCASSLIALRAALDLAEGPGIRRHDARLGWVSLPSLSVPEMWGPGGDLHTNARGFRGREEVDDAVPPGRVRVVCSGDSFAFGDGVGDEQTWCHRLSQLDPRIEAVNLGQSGYGVDQAYLRYRRVASELEIDLHVFSFIGPDLTRAGEASFYGFAKPIFRLEDGELVLSGVPVPETGPTLRRVFLGGIEQLRISEFMRRGINKLFGGRRRKADDLFERIGPVVERIFEAAARVPAADDGAPGTVFLYLPLRSEREQDGRWRGWVRESFARTGLPLVDLTDALRAEPAEEAYEFFIPDGAAAGGHYSRRGNAWAARALYAEIRPRIDARAASLSR
jgi:hypothetical protein